MNVSTTDVENATGFKKSWVSSRFSHIQEDYVVYGKCQYDVHKLSNEILRQLEITTKSHNQIQTIKRNEMLNIVLSFLKDKISNES